MFIVGLNAVLRMTTIYLTKWIGFTTVTQLMKEISNRVFMVLFFNTGILLVLVNANLEDVSVILSKLFDGQFYDYSPEWYGTVGYTIVQTMLVNAFMSPVNEVIVNLTEWFF